MNSLFFCKRCGQTLLADALFCEQCGTPTATDLPVIVRTESTVLSGGVTSFFASQATLCLFTLLVFSGLVVALAPAGWRYASLQLKSNSWPAAASSDTRSLGASDIPARCNQVVVIFNAATTVARVSSLLEQLDTTIAFGPNENGAFELLVPSTSASGVTDALNRVSDAVVSASLQRRCL